MEGRIDAIMAFLEKTPKDNFLRHALALEWIKLGNDVKAREIFENILTDSPNYIGSYYHLAKLLERISEIDAAITWYERGLEQAKLANDTHSYNELRTAYEELLM